MARKSKTSTVAEIERVFDSFDEYVTFALQPSKWQDTASTGFGPYSDARAFNGNCTWDDAVRMARYGWSEGRDKLAQAIAVAAPERAMVAANERDVAGEYPLIPAAVAGDPCCMMTRRRSHVAAKPIVRIDYNPTVHGGIPATAIMNRGAALLSMVDALETRGYSCELRIIFTSHKDNQKLHVAVTYKRAGEPLDIDRAAFALAHPATMRRFFFACIEQFPELERNFSPNHGNSYGHPGQTPWDDDPASIFIDGATNADNTTQTALSRMQALFNDYLEN